MGKNYELISTVDIDIASPIVEDTSFDNLLIVGPLPATIPATGAPAEVGSYANLEEVLKAGWKCEGNDADPVGVAAKVAFAQNPTPNEIYIAPIQMVEGEPADDSEEPTMVQENITATLTRAVAKGDWYIVCPAGVPSSDYADIAAFIETSEKMFMYPEMNFFDGTESNEPTVTGTYYRTMAIFGKESSAQLETAVPAENKYIHVAWAARWLSYQSGSETSAFKTLSGIHTCELSANEQKALKENYVSYYANVGGKGIVIGGKVIGNEWADVIRFRDYLKNDIQIRVANVFVATPKVPYDDSGIALIHNQMLAALKAGQDIGGIAQDEYDADGNLIPGYTTNVPALADISASERASRTLSNCTFTARLQGAIHFAELKGSLVYEL